MKSLSSALSSVIPFYCQWYVLPLSYTLGRDFHYPTFREKFLNQKSNQIISAHTVTIYQFDLPIDYLLTRPLPSHFPFLSSPPAVHSQCICYILVFCAKFKMIKHRWNNLCANEFPVGLDLRWHFTFLYRNSALHIALGFVLLCDILALHNISFIQIPFVYIFFGDFGSMITATMRVQKSYAGSIYYYTKINTKCPFSCIYCLLFLVLILNPARASNAMNENPTSIFKF